MKSVLTLQQLSSRNYGLVFLNFTGIPCILEDLIINEIRAAGKVPIILVDKKYLKNITSFAMKELDVGWFIYDGLENLFFELDHHIDPHSKLKDNSIVSHLAFKDFNCFTTTIYYHPKQFQIESIKDDIVIESSDMKYFFRYVEDLVLDKKTKEKVLSYKDCYKVEKLVIEKGNRSFDEFIPMLRIDSKRSSIVDSVINPSLEIGCLNQSIVGSPHLLSGEMYKLLK